MKIAYIDHQNIKLGVMELGREIDWQRFYIYLKDHYKPDQVCLFIGYIDSEKEKYEYYKSIGYTLFFKSTYKYNIDSKPKGNVDTLLSHIATKDVLTFLTKLKSCILISGDSDFDVIAKYRDSHNIQYKRMIPNEKKLSKLIQITIKQENLLYISYLKEKLQLKTLKDLDQGELQDPNWH